MEEDKYKSTYNDLASVRCVFEKALTSNQAKCAQSKHFCLADREGYACSDKEYSIKCAEFLEKLRKSSVFALKLRNVSGPLPHNMELRVQAGGINGLTKLNQEKLSQERSSQEKPDKAEPQVDEIPTGINDIINRSIERFGSLNDLPYSQIIQSVVQFRGRQRRQRK